MAFLRSVPLYKDVIGYIREPDLPKMEQRIPVRVAFLTNFLLPDKTSVMMSFACLVDRLRVLVSAKTKTEEGGELVWDGLDVVAQKSLRWRHRFRHIYGYSDETEVQVPLDTISQLWRYKPDVVISGEFGARTLSTLLYCRLRPKTRHILWATLSQRTEATRSRWRVRLRQWILRHVDAVFVNGKDGHDYITSLGFKGPLQIVPYVVDATEFEGTTTVPDDGILRVLYAGKLNDRKGIFPFVEALYRWGKEHPDRKIQLRIAGRGPQKESIAALQCPSNITTEFLGFLSRPQLIQAYHAATLYAFPTLGDEWGLVVNEALSSGLPVLGSVHSQAVVEMLQDGTNGWLFDPSDPQDMMRGIDHACSTDYATFLRMADAARSSVVEWTPQNVAKKIADAILQMEI